MSAITFLTAATSTGASSIKEHTRLVKNHVVQVTITGAPSAVIIDLEGSIDGTTFFQIATKTFSAGELTAAAALFFAIDKPLLFVRLNLKTLTAGTAPTVTGKYEGDSIGVSKVSRRGAF